MHFDVLNRYLINKTKYPFNRYHNRYISKEWKLKKLMIVRSYKILSKCENIIMSNQSIYKCDCYEHTQINLYDLKFHVPSVYIDAKNFKSLKCNFSSNVETDI